MDTDRGWRRMSLPNPYYDQDGITIYHADCRDILPLLEPGSVDLVLTDPPYGVRYVTARRSRTRRHTADRLVPDQHSRP